MKWDTLILFRLLNNYKKKKIRFKRIYALYGNSRERNLVKERESESGDEITAINLPIFKITYYTHKHTHFFSKNIIATSQREINIKCSRARTAATKAKIYTNRVVIGMNKYSVCVRSLFIYLSIPTILFNMPISNCWSLNANRIFPMSSHTFECWTQGGIAFIMRRLNWINFFFQFFILFCCCCCCCCRCYSSCWSSPFILFCFNSHGRRQRSRVYMYVHCTCTRSRTHIDLNLTVSKIDLHTLFFSK